jgi:hypothetical protein
MERMTERMTGQCDDATVVKRGFLQMTGAR